MSQYQWKNGKVEEVAEITMPSNSERFFKVNLPDSLENEESGNGEGVWAAATDEDYEKWEKDEEEIIFVKVANNSVYYSGLNYGDVIPVKLRPGYRPIAFFEELTHRHGASQKESAMQKLKNYQMKNLQ